MKKFFWIQLIIAGSLLSTSAIAADENGSLEQTMLSIHNALRAKHSAPPVEWDSTLADFALKHAQQCGFNHSGGPYGENWAAGYATPKAAVQGWYDEGKNYDYSAATFSYDTAHFTQVVWVGTKKIGCANVPCKTEDGNTADFLVCEYDPAGNYTNEGYFEKNVLPLK